MSDDGVMKSVLIVGGGTAGWLTACLLAAEHGSNLDITLVESPDVPIIGVGEGTWPSMRTTLQRIGIDEVDVLRACSASFKQGTEFVNWLYDDKPHTYYHPFSLPFDYAATNLADYWLSSEIHAQFGEMVTPQVALMAQGRAPKTEAVPPYAYQLNYGYHFDAAAFALLLTNYAIERLGVRHRQAFVTNVRRTVTGNIESIGIDDGDALTADLFIDCTGQRALLVGDTPWCSLTHVSPNNRALVVQVPYHSEDAPIPSFTRAQAMDQGWIWDIGLQNRRGVGFVHNDDYSSEQDAYDRLEAYLKQHDARTLAELTPRFVRFKAGYRPQPWQGNCVAVGLSAGFIEPLEASAIALIEQAAGMIADALPLTQSHLAQTAQDFNARMELHWQSIVEFLKLHYVLSRRTRSEYWRMQRDTGATPESLKIKLQRWSHRSIWHIDAPRYDELFPSASYQYVAYGLDYRPSMQFAQRAAFRRKRAAADAALHRVAEAIRQLEQQLPTNRELLTRLVGRASSAQAGVA